MRILRPSLLAAGSVAALYLSVVPEIQCAESDMTTTVGAKSNSDEFQTRQRLQQLFDAQAQRRARWLQDYFQGPPPQSKQFDFLLGEWDTTLRSYDLDQRLLQEIPGEWMAKSIDGGRMVQDEYRSYLPNGAVLSGAVTLRTYSPETRQWEMAFLNAMQPNPVTTFVAQFENGEIHGQAHALDKGVASDARIRFFSITADSFEWEQELSWDQGRSWYRIITISAKRRSATTQ